jgi:hypothetical protein
MWEILMPNVTEKIRKIKANCPAGYSVNDGYRSINMLGKKELWSIYEHHTEPHVTRIPQDLIDDGNGSPCAARVPKEWGRCVYYKVA